MLTGRLESARSERGTTLVELLVATTTGIVVMGMLALLIIVVLHSSTRVSARVDATQQSRLAVTRIVDQLHSACLAPKASPIYEKSSGTKLVFIHAVGAQSGQVAPIPTKTEIQYTEGKLMQLDKAGVGTYPNTTYPGSAVTTTLATKVAPIAPSTSIFTYFGSVNNTVGEVVPGTEGLTAAQALGVIEVRVGLNVSPLSSGVRDAGAAASIKDGAVLRLTPPSFNEKAGAPPCQ